MQSKNECQVSFIIPAYNEAKRLPDSFDQIIAFSKELKENHEWIFVIEPSSDHSHVLISEFCKNNSNARYIANEEKKGKGYAVKSGMLAAKGEWAFFMDADLSTPLKEIFKFRDFTKKHPEFKILIGSRKQNDSRVLKKQGVIRSFVGKSLNSLLRLLDLTEFSDTQCGFKAFHQSTVLSLFKKLNSDGFSFDIEILANAKKQNYKIKEIGIDWYNNDDSRLNLAKDGFIFAKDLIKIYYSLSK